MTLPPRATVLAAALSLFSALASACSSDDGEAASTSSSAGPTTEPGSTSATDPTETTTSADSTGGTGAADTTGGADDSSTGTPPGARVVVGVGYGGMRVRSLDDGNTWQDYVQLGDAGGDDEDLLRGCTWGGGRFVAAGWRIFSSTDGVTWEEHDNPTGQWLGAVAHGNGMFLGVGGGGFCARSPDGVAWESCTDVTDGEDFEHVRSTLFFDGLFFTADEDGDLRSSPDGEVWSLVGNVGGGWIAEQGGEIVYLDQGAPAEFDGFRLRGSIERAPSGSEDFVGVYAAPNGNSVTDAKRFGFCEGFVD